MSTGTDRYRYFSKHEEIPSVESEPAVPRLSMLFYRHVEKTIRNLRSSEPRDHGGRQRAYEAAHVHQRVNTLALLRFDGEEVKLYYR